MKLIYIYSNNNLNRMSYNVYSKCSKISNTFLFLFSNKNLIIMVGFTKCLSEEQTGKTLTRLLLQKQSDLLLPWLSRNLDRQQVFKIFEHLVYAAYKQIYWCENFDFYSSFSVYKFFLCVLISDLVLRHLATLKSCICTNNYGQMDAKNR